MAPNPHSPQPSDALHPLIRGRSSPRRFAPGGVSDAQLLTVLEAARWAPSCSNEQPWRFVVARRPSPAFDGLVGCLSEGNQGWAGQAPVLLLTAAQAAFAARPGPNRHAWHDVGLAVAQLTLQAAALGLAVRQMAGFSVEAARVAVGMPAGYDPVTVLALGPRPSPEEATPEGPVRAPPRQRRPLAETVHAGSWGAPLALDPGPGQRGL